MTSLTTLFNKEKKEKAQEDDSKLFQTQNKIETLKKIYKKHASHVLHVLKQVATGNLYHQAIKNPLKKTLSSSMETLLDYLSIAREVSKIQKAKRERCITNRNAL